MLKRTRKNMNCWFQWEIAYAIEAQNMFTTTITTTTSSSSSGNSSSSSSSSSNNI